MARWNVTHEPTGPGTVDWWMVYRNGRLQSRERTRQEGVNYVENADASDPDDILVLHNTDGLIVDQQKVGGGTVTVATVAKNDGRWRVFIDGGVEGTYNAKDSAISDARDALSPGDMIAVQNDIGRFERNIEVG